MKKTSIEDIKISNKSFLVPADIAPILGVNPYSINLAAKNNPDGLGFPVTIMGSRVLIPRLPFIAFCEGQAKT